MEIFEVQKVLRVIPDFPKAGINFVDVNPLLTHVGARQAVLKNLVARYKDQKIDAVAGLETRGYFFGIPLAMELGVPFVPLRKPGKLPGQVLKVDYGKEYGTDQIEVQADAIKQGQRVLVHDDLLATGGTAGAGCKLVEQAGGVVAEFMCLVELADLKGREKLPNVVVHSVWKM